MASLIAFGSLVVSLAHAGVAAYKWYSGHKSQLDQLSAVVADLQSQVLAAFQGR